MAKPAPKIKAATSNKIPAEGVFSKYKKYFLPIILAITFLVFLPSLQNKFVNLDDPQYLINNPAVHTLNVVNIKLIFSEQFVGNYQPLTMLSYMLEYKIWELNPFGYHLTNLVLHLLNTLFVFLIIQKIGSFLFKSNALLVAFLTSLLFGIHPLHVESVAWISERKDVLYGFFFLWSLYLYISGSLLTSPARGGTVALFPSLMGRARVGLLLFLFTLALLSKAQAVVLPLVFFAVDFLLGRKINKQTILEKVPFFLLAIAFGVLAINVQGKAGAMQTFQYFPLYERLLFSCYALMTYLHKIILPINLSCFYPYPETDDKINTIWVYLSPAVLLALAFIIWKYFKESKFVLFGAAFFIITIALVLQLLPVGDALYADRYTYLPSIGLFFIVAYYITPLLKNKMVLSGAGVCLLLLAYSSFNRNKVWHDSITLYTDAINNGHQAAILYTNRGAVLSDSSRNEEALQDFIALVKLKPRYPNAWRNKGLIEVRLKKKDDAINSFTKAINQVPTDYLNYLSRGTIYVEKNYFESAIKDFSEIININPQSGEGFYARSEAYGKSGKLNKALADINKTIEFAPENGQAYNNRGIILSMSGKYEESVISFSKSLELKPDNVSAYANRALSYKSLGKFNEALQDMLTAKEKGGFVNEAELEELKQLANKK